MSRIKQVLGVISHALLIASAVIISVFSFVYKKLLKRPFKGVLEKMILPLLDTLDDEYGGFLIFSIFLIELGLYLILPWFFSWKIGVILISYLLLTIGFVMLILKYDDNKPWVVTLFMSWITPYLVMAFFPTAVITIVRKKEKPTPTIIELRRTKLKRLKKKIRINKYKFWKR